nr:FAD-binding oxidoreductase [uncultured Moellerella sp.]
MQIDQKKKIIIIGAGIVGVMQAWYLAKSGDAQVILLEKNQAGLGVTQDSFAWLNVSYGRPDAYQYLRAQAIAEWRELDKQTQGQLNINWSGALSWMSTPEETAQFIETHHQAGFNIKALTAQQLSARVPALVNPPEIAAFAEDEGAVDPQHVIKILLSQAQKIGVEYHSDTQVIRLLNQENKIAGVETSKGDFYGDIVVLTAGTGSLSLLAERHIALPLYPSPSIFLQLSHQAPSEFLPCIISTPEMELRPFGKNTLIAAEDYIDDSAEQHPERIGESAKAIFCERFRGTETLKLEQVRVGQRPMPNDEMPIVDKISPYQGLYIVTMHAAVTLSPLVCQLAAEEILQQTEMALLAPYRLARFS